MTALERALIARRDADSKVKSAAARLGQAHRWAPLHPDRWPPEKIRELELVLNAARKELNDLTGKREAA